MDVVVAVARLVVDLVDGMAGETGEPRLRFRCERIDFLGHVARQHDGRIVTAAAELRLLLALGVARELHRLAIEGIVERREAVRRRGPLLDDVHVAALAALRAQEMIGRKTLFLGLVLKLLQVRKRNTEDPGWL